MRRRNAHRRWLIAAFAIVLAASALRLGASAPAAPGESAAVLTASTATDVSIGAALSVTGSLSEAGRGLADVALALQIDPYPFHGFTTVAQTSTAADGSFTFAGPEADRNVRLRVVREVPGAPTLSSATLAVYVDPLPALRVRPLGPGRAQLTLRLRHTEHGGSSGSSQAAWFVAARGTRVFRLLAVTPTREIEPGLTYASTIINPPAKRFIYRVCLNPGWEQAMGRPAEHGRCPQSDYTVRHDASAAFVFGGEGHGVPKPPYPSAGAIAAAAAIPRRPRRAHLASRLSTAAGG